MSQLPADPVALPMERLSSAVVPHDKVIAFVWSVIRHAVPAVSADAACILILGVTPVPGVFLTSQRKGCINLARADLGLLCRACWVTQGRAEVCGELSRA